jgi:hypothetical protein
MFRRDCRFRHIFNTAVTKYGKNKTEEGGDDAPKEAKEEVGEGWKDEGKAETKYGEEGCMNYPECESNRILNGGGFAADAISFH